MWGNPTPTQIFAKFACYVLQKGAAITQPKETSQIRNKLVRLQ